jgi:hypothetical protein
VTAFIARWDLHERGLFYCASTLKQGSRARNKESTAELPMLFADIDLKDVNEDVEEIERKLKALRFPPSIIVRSGNGVHSMWLLTEALDVQADGMRDRIEDDLRQLADLVGGDLQVCEVARILRLPGTHNTKRGEYKEVLITHPVDISDDAQVMRHDLTDLEEWFGEQSPIILRKERPRAVPVSQAGDDCPYKAYAKEHGIKHPIDVEERLNAMMYMGVGENSIHATQIAVAASMVNSGHTDEEIVEVLLSATRAAARLLWQALALERRGAQHPARPRQLAGQDGQGRQRAEAKGGRASTVISTVRRQFRRDC